MTKIYRDPYPHLCRAKVTGGRGYAKDDEHRCIGRALEGEIYCSRHINKVKVLTCRAVVYGGEGYPPHEAHNCRRPHLKDEDYCRTHANQRYLKARSK